MTVFEETGALARNELVRVRQTPDDRHVVAITPIAAGELIVNLHGHITNTPTRYSVQLGLAEHLVPSPDCPDEALVTRFPWCFLNHSCAPNAVVAGRSVVAIRGITPEEAVTFDYNTTEVELASPFACHCGAAECVGIVRGARHLTRGQRERRWDQLAPYLRELTP